MERGPSVANPDSPMPSEHNQSPPRHGIDTPKYREETFSPFSNSVSTSASDYRSVRSSPSPVLVPESSELRRAPSDSWQSSDSEVPSFRSAFSEKEAINAPLSAQNTISLSVASRGQADGEDTPIPSSFSDISGPIYHEEPTIMGPSLHNQPNGRPTNGSSLSLLSRDKSLFSRGSSFNVSSPSPPGSSIGSESAPPSSVPDAALSFEAQIKASPFIDSIMQRLANCEYSSREIQRELGDVHRKLDLLVQRSQGNNMNQGNGELEFRNPFASPSVITPGNPSQNFNVSPFQNGPAQRGSTAGVNPDDITQLSQRLNTLTTSVGQLLAIQTQQHIQNTNAPLQPHRESIVSIQQHRDSIAGFNSGMNTPQEIAPNQLVSPPINAPGVGLGPGLGHGFPPRDLRPPVPGVRTPNPPMRTWSAGSLELPMRPQDNMNRPPDFARKRGSVATGLMRRESSGLIDNSGEQWNNANGNNANSSRDPAGMVSKWEHLPLAPELLRSIAKFGVGPPNKVQQRALPFLLRGSDIIAQAPPTQERIAAYVIPAIHVALTYMNARPALRGPIVIMISTTVDQATQAQRMIRDLGGPIGVRSALGVGSTNGNNQIVQETRLLQQNMPHILCGTPQKLHGLFTTPGGLAASEVRFLVLDEVDQLIARNLHEYVFNIVKLLPPPRSRPLGPTSGSPAPSTSSKGSSFNGLDSNGSPALGPSFPGPIRRFSTAPSPGPIEQPNPDIVERQTALFSNTVPQDVLNLANAIQLREPIRVLVRRDGNVTHADTTQSSRGLRQFYLYLAFTAGGRAETLPGTPGGGHGIIGSGRGATNAETAQAREWKLDALADLFEDIEVSQAIVHVGGLNALDSVVYKLASKGLEAVPLHGDMNAGTKLAALNKFRNSTSGMMRQPVAKVLVVYDVQVKAPDVFQVPLVINYDLPKAVEEYAHRVAPAVSSSYARAGVVINFVTATGGDVEMLRSIECFYKIKCPEVPMSLRDVL